MLCTYYVGTLDCIPIVVGLLNLSAKIVCCENAGLGLRPQAHYQA